MRAEPVARRAAAEGDVATPAAPIPPVAATTIAEGRVPAGDAGRVCLLATLITIAMAWPVLLAPSERIFGGEIVGRHHDPFTVIQQFAGGTVPAPYLQPVTDWAGRGLALVLSPVAAYNVIVLATFPCAALCAYLLAFELTKSTLASAVAGLGFAFSPFHVAHAAYHPHIAQVQWLPLYLFALWRSLHGFTAWRAALLAFATVTVAASNFYGGFIAAVVTPPLLVAQSVVPDVGRARWRDLGSTLAVLAATAGCALALARLLEPAAFDPGGPIRAPIADLFRYSGIWWAHFVPPVDHVVLGPVAASVWTRYDAGADVLEQQLYLGAGMIGLALVAVWQWSRGGRPTALRFVPILAAMAAVAGLCMLSPSRQVLGVAISRPSAVLHELAPMFRAYARFSVVVQLMVVMLAGIGAASLWQRRAVAARVAVVVLLVLAAFEYAPVPWRWRDVLPTTAHRWLASRGGTPRVLDCAGPSLAERSTSWLAGYSILYADSAEPDCAEPSLGLQLQRAGFTHLLVRRTSRAWPILVGRSRPDLVLAHQAPDAAVFEVAGVPRAFVGGLRGCHPREFTGQRSGCWSSGRATWTVWNPAGSPVGMTVVMELASFASPRHVDVAVDGRHVGDVLVDQALRSRRIGPIVLPIGRSELALSSAEPPMAPHERDPSDADRRPLAIYIGEWDVEPNR